MWASFHLVSRLSSLEGKEEEEERADEGVCETERRGNANRRLTTITDSALTVLVDSVLLSSVFRSNV